MYQFVRLPAIQNHKYVRAYRLFVEMKLQPEIYRIYLLAYGFVQRA